MNRDLHDNAIGYFTDMFVMSSDDRYAYKMSMTQQYYYNYLLQFLPQDVIAALEYWGHDLMMEVNSDFEPLAFPENMDLVRWIIVSWFAEMLDRELDVSAFFTDIIGVKIEDDKIRDLCTLSRAFHIKYSPMKYSPIGWFKTN